MKKIISSILKIVLACSLIFAFTSCKQVSEIIAEIITGDENVTNLVIPVIANDNPVATIPEDFIGSALPIQGDFNATRWIPLESNGLKTVSGLEGQNLFLVRVNKGRTKVQPSKAGSVKTVSIKNGAGNELLFNARNAVVQKSSAIPYPNLQIPTTEPTTFGYAPAEEFSANLPIIRKGERAGIPTKQQSRVYTEDENLIAGSRGYFWVDNDRGNNKWKKIPCTLKAVGTNCKIWVADYAFDDTANDTNENGKLTQSRVNDFQTTFDKLYDIETGIIGYEYGGGPVSDGKNPHGQISGGCDGDTDIQILIYDMGNETPGSGTAGYFWAKDFYTQEELNSDSSTNSLKTNYAEIFYIDAGFAAIYKNICFSVLAHEFQHMIHFNQKQILQNQDSSTWYNEMFSSMIEDIMSYTVGCGIPEDGNNTNTLGQNPFPTTIPDGHIIGTRIPRYLNTYPNLGTLEWTNDSSSYETVFILGAFLSRTATGSADTALNTMMNDDTIDTESIKKLLSDKPSINNFDDVIEHIAKGMMFNRTIDDSPSGNAFDNPRVSTPGVNSDKDLYAFDPWKIKNIYLQNEKDLPCRKYLYGPSIFDLQAFVMKPYSYSFHTDENWGTSIWTVAKENSKDEINFIEEKTYKTYEEALAKSETVPDSCVTSFLTGLGKRNDPHSVTIDVSLPADSNVKMYLVVR